MRQLSQSIFNMRLSRVRCKQSLISYFQPQLPRPKLRVRALRVASEERNEAGKMCINLLNILSKPIFSFIHVDFESNNRIIDGIIIFRSYYEWGKQ